MIIRLIIRFARSDSQADNKEGSMAMIPFVISEREGKERQFDIFSLLLRDRIIFINGVLDDNVANSIIAQLLYLDSMDSEKEVNLYINS